jgi:hypothetical protein
MEGAAAFRLLKTNHHQNCHPDHRSFAQANMARMCPKSSKQNSGVFKLLPAPSEFQSCRPSRARPHNRKAKVDCRLSREFCSSFRHFLHTRISQQPHAPILNRPRVRSVENVNQKAATPPPMTRFEILCSKAFVPSHLARNHLTRLLGTIYNLSPLQ